MVNSSTQTDVPAASEQSPVSPEAVDEVTRVRSRVGGLEQVQMSPEQKALFDESAELQNKIARELSQVPNTETPEITPDMIRVVKIAQQLSGGSYPSPATLKAFRAGNDDTPAFGLGTLSFEATPAGGKIENWAQAFSAMIDAIDPDNNLRFVS